MEAAGCGHRMHVRCQPVCEPTLRIFARRQLCLSRLHFSASGRRAFFGISVSACDNTTAWPANDELTRPYLGYVHHPMRVVRINDFTLEQLVSGADSGVSFDMALVFSTKYQPPHPLLAHWRWWQEAKIHFFDYHHDLPPAVAARILGGDVVFEEHRNGQWVALVEIHEIHDARWINLWEQSVATAR